MEISKEKLDYYFKKAKEAKEASKSTYNDVASYCYNSFTIKDEARDKDEIRSVETVISTSINTFVNTIMTGVFSRGANWATTKVNDILFQNANSTEIDTAVESRKKEINESLEKGTQTTFEYINQTNFYTEIAKMVKDWAVLGTGAYKIRATGDINKPFTYLYMSLDGLYFLENQDSKIEIVFRERYKFKKRDITESYGDKAKIPTDLTEDEAEMTIIECCVPSEKVKGQYEFLVLTTDYETVIHEEVLSYNPFVISRMLTEGVNIWGIGLGVIGLDLFKELKRLKTLREEQAQNIVKPPYIARGDTQLIEAFRMQSGRVNFGGRTVPSIGAEADNENFMTVENVRVSESLIPVENDIANIKNDIRELFISNPISDVAEYKNRSATETQARMQIFRIRWSGPYENLQIELLEPTLMVPFRILTDQKIITFSESETEGEKFNLDFTTIQYINELSKMQGLEKVQNLINYATMADQLKQLASGVALKPLEVINELKEVYRIPLKISMSDQEFKQAEDEKQALIQQAQIAAQQPPEGGTGLETGINGENTEVL